MAEPQLKIYQVEAPDGSILKLEGPVGASQEDIIKNAEILFNQRQAQQPQYNMGAESLRSLAQGATFGSADEIEAALRTAPQQLSKEMQLGGLAAQIPTTEPQKVSLSDQMGAGLGSMVGTLPSIGASDYKKVRDEIRGRQQLFQKEHPVLSTGLEIAGGLAVPIGAVGTAAKGGTTLAGNLARGAGYGALYGTGQAKEAADIPLGAAQGAATGGIFTGVTNVLGRTIAPKITEAAKKLRDQGISLTPGQAFGGIIDKAEQSLSNVIGSIGKRRGENILKWNESTINRALKPLGEKVKIEGDDIQGAMDTAISKISSAYQKIVPKLKITSNDKFKEKATQILNKEEFATADAAAKIKFRNFINDEMSSLKSGKFGEALKNRQTSLNNTASDFIKKGGDDATFGRMVAEYKKLFDKQIIAQNPSYGADLARVNRAFKDMARVEDAASKVNTTAGMFTPNQLLASARKMDISPRKRQTAAGTAPMVKTAREGGVLGQTLPDSGTTARAIYNIGLPVLAGAGVGTGAGAAALGGILGGQALYSQLGQRGFNRLIQEPSAVRGAIGEGLSRYAPAATSLLNIRDNRYE